MSDEVKLSKPYSSSLEAMMGGFKQIQATRKDWETKEYNFLWSLYPRSERRPITTPTRRAAQVMGRV
jgi:hypothetical protein